MRQGVIQQEVKFEYHKLWGLKSKRIPRQWYICKRLGGGHSTGAPRKPERAPETEPRRWEDEPTDRVTRRSPPSTAPHEPCRRASDRAEMAAEEDAAAAGAAVQLIDGEGGFAADSVERFMAAAGVADCGLSYAVVSIMGPQSSGTSVRACVTYQARRTRTPDRWEWRARAGMPPVWSNAPASASRPICCVRCVLRIGRSIRLTARLMRLLGRRRLEFARALLRLVVFRWIFFWHGFQMDCWF